MGIPDSEIHEDAASTEGAVVEVTSCGAFVDVAVGAISWIVDTNCATEPGEATGRTQVDRQQRFTLPQSKKAADKFGEAMA